MDIRQLTYFCDSVSLGSFSEAAATHGVTVQAISKSIADLEREVGRALLVRDKFGVYPNNDGIAFVSRAEDVLERFGELRSLTSQRGTWHGEDKTIRMVICSPRVGTFIPFSDVIGRIANKATGLEVSVDVDTCTNGARRLRSGTCDILVTLGNCTRSDLECRQFGTARAEVLMAPNSPLAELDSITVNDLNGYPTGHFEPMDSICDGILGTYIRKRGLTSPVVIVHNDDEAVRACVEQNAYFLTLRPPREGHFKDMTVRRLADEDRIPVPLCIVCLRKRRHPSFSKLADVLTEGAQSLLRLATE